MQGIPKKSGNNVFINTDQNTTRGGGKGGGGVLKIHNGSNSKNSRMKIDITFGCPAEVVPEQIVWMGLNVSKLQSEIIVNDGKCLSN
jgi:hypothetical protein